MLSKKKHEDIKTDGKDLVKSFQALDLSVLLDTKQKLQAFSASGNPETKAPYTSIKTSS